MHLVTVLEEMPVQETADGIAELREHGLPVGGVVVNQVRPRDLDDDDLAAVRAGQGRPRRQIAADLTRAGLEPARRRWSTACSPRPATTPSGGRSRTPSARWSTTLDVPTYELPAARRRHRPRRRSTSWPALLRDQGLA